LCALKSFSQARPELKTGNKSRNSQRSLSLSPQRRTPQSKPPSHPISPRRHRASAAAANPLRCVVFFPGPNPAAAARGGPKSHFGFSVADIFFVRVLRSGDHRDRIGAGFGFASAARVRARSEGGGGGVSGDNLLRGFLLVRGDFLLLLQ
jgi:hypothetical protein